MYKTDRVLLVVAHGLLQWMEPNQVSSRDQRQGQGLTPPWYTTTCYHVTKVSSWWRRMSSDTDWRSVFSPCFCLHFLLPEAFSKCSSPQEELIYYMSHSSAWHATQQTAYSFNENNWEKPNFSLELSHLNDRQCVGSQKIICCCEYIWCMWRASQSTAWLKEDGACEHSPSLMNPTVGPFTS